MGSAGAFGDANGSNVGPIDGALLLVFGSALGPLPSGHELSSALVRPDSAASVHKVPG